VLFDADGCLRKFDRIEDIFDDFFKARRQKYIERKRFLEGMLQAQALRLSNQVTIDIIYTVHDGY
jgi:DNA topoisomerase-2